MNEFVRGYLEGEAASTDVIQTKRVYVDINEGRLIDGTIFGRIMYWHGISKKGQQRLRVFKDGHYWLVKRYGDWWDECRVKEGTARKSINRMLTLGLLKKALYKFDGSPTLHLRIDWQKFQELVEKVRTDGSDLRGQNGPESDPNCPDVTDGSDTRGQNEMTLEDRTLTSTTSNNTTSIKDKDLLLRLKADLRLQTTQATYDTIIAPIHSLERMFGIVKLCTSRLSADWLQNRFMSKLEKYFDPLPVIVEIEETPNA